LLIEKQKVDFLLLLELWTYRRTSNFRLFNHWPLILGLGTINLFYMGFIISIHVFIHDSFVLSM